MTVCRTAPASQVGQWRKGPCHRSRGLVERASQMRKDHIQFGKTIKLNSLYAAAGDPKNLERGGRPYWLLRTASSKAFETKKKLRAFDHAKAPIIKPKTWVIRAQWYLSTATDPRAKRHAYKLLPDYVYVTVASIVQEPWLAVPA